MTDDMIKLSHEKVLEAVEKTKAYQDEFSKAFTVFTGFHVKLCENEIWRGFSKSTWYSLMRDTEKMIHLAVSDYAFLEKILMQILMEFESYDAEIAKKLSTMPSGGAS